MKQLEARFMSDIENTGADATTHEDLTLLGSKSTTYNSSPEESKLEAFQNSHPQRDYWINLDCPEFTSICPITGQPDFGKLSIRYIPDQKCVESKSLKLYLFSYRNHGAFHEEVVNRILDDIVNVVHPRRAVVQGEFRPRGGIAITVTAEYPQNRESPATG
jgi:7-cyano-7-deazaguanine reductase